MERVVFGGLIGVAVAVPTLLIAVFAAGAGHGTYGLACLFFPLPMLSTILTDHVISKPARVFAIFQFPVFGALVGYASTKRKAAIVFVAGIAMHMAAFYLCLANNLPSF